MLIAGADESAEITRLLVRAGHTVLPQGTAPEQVDVLVNTAALAPETFEAKVAGLARVLQDHLPALERSAAPVVVNVSDADPLTRAAATVVTAQYARAFPHVRINAVERHAETIARLALAGPDGPTGGYFAPE